MPTLDTAISSASNSYSITVGSGVNQALIISATFNVGVGGATCTCTVDGVTATQKAIVNAAGAPGVAGFVITGLASGSRAIVVTVTGTAASFTASEAWSWFSAQYDTVSTASAGGATSSSDTFTVAANSVVCSLINSTQSTANSLTATAPLSLDSRPTTTTAAGHSSVVSGSQTIGWTWATTGLFSQVDMSLKALLTSIPNGVLMMGVGVG